MTNVQKVSIGGYAFTLEEEAYEIVKQYLDELNTYYSQREGGAEVMEGIEERMAELLYEKCADDGVASVAEVREIMDILGNPSAIESDDDTPPKQAGAETGRPDRPKEKKRLFRDPTNKMLGGVCSGLAAYFKCDVVLIRIIFIGLCVLSCVVGCNVGDNVSIYLPFPLLYVILWIAMPEARTVQQRWQMGVTNPPAGAVSSAASSGKPLGSGLGRVLRIVIGCLLVLAGVSGLTFGLAAMFGHSLFGWNFMWDSEGVFQGSFLDAVRVHAPGMLPMVSSVFYQIAVLLTCFLPFIGMLYAGIMMIFDLRSPSWRPGLILFLLWIIALTTFTILTLMGLFHAGLLDRF